MKLYELTRPPIGEVETRLRAHGYNLIGSGSYGAVFYKEGANTVMKLFQEEDFAYMSFLEMTKKHPNPYWPLSYGKPFHVTERFYGIKLERLHPYSGRLPKACEKLYHVLEAGSLEDKRYLEEMKKIAPKFVEAICLIHFMISKTGSSYDIHMSNIMKRNNDHAVIVDPLVP